MLINYTVFKNDFELTNGLRNMHNSGFLILFDRIIVPEADNSDYIYVLFNPALGYWNFVKLNSRSEPDLHISDIFKNADIITRFKNRNELITLNYMSNPGNSNRVELPPHHMLTNNIRMGLDIDGEHISNIEVTLGYHNNRLGTKEYMNLLPVLERLTLSNRVSAPLLLAQLIEDINKVPITEKEESIRKIFDSLIKIISHINVFIKLSVLISNKGLFNEFSDIVRSLNHLIYLYSGNDLFPNFVLFGGVKKDIPEDWIKEAKTIFSKLERLINKFESSVLFSRSFLETTSRSGQITKKEALELCLTGTILRASGVDIDFQEISSGSTLGQDGSTWDRYFVKLAEIKRHIHCIDELMDNLPEGSVRKNIHHSIFTANNSTAEGQINNFMLSLDPITIPPGDYFRVTESASGLLSIFIRSRGEHKPYYVSLRTGAKTNVLAYSKALNQNIRSFEYFATSLDINGMDIMGNIYE
jgi:NADH-quinone oxidoreductase subunit D